MRTKENQNAMIYTNETLWGEANPHTSGTKEAYQLNDDRKSDAFQPFIKSEGGDAGSLTPFLPNFPVGNEHGSRGSPVAEYHSELSRKTSIESNTHSSVYFLNEGKKVQNSLDSMNKCRDSSKPNSSFQMDVASYGNNSVLEHDTFDSEDHRKGRAEHVLKDISVDEVDYPVDKFSLRSSKNDKSSTSVAISSNMFRHGSTEVGYDVEPSVSYRSAGLSFEGSTASDDDESLDDQVNVQESSKSQPRKSFDQDPPKFSVNSVQKHESNSGTSPKNVYDVPQAGTQRIFRSFLTSFGDEETKISTGISTFEGSKPASTVTELPEDEQRNSSSEQSPNKDRKTPEQANHEKENALDVAVSNQGKYDFGETSFSKASLVTYNEPIPQPGNISMRSDGSISGRSFAFPILQSEWNSSPVKMAKADRRHYRKHRGWRSGIFCCGF